MKNVQKKAPLKLPETQVFVCVFILSENGGFFSENIIRSSSG